MEIVVAEQGAFYFDPLITPEEARGRASAHKVSAFGTISRLFARPKDEDIAVSDQGLWYLPLWHAKAHLRFVYERSESYKIQVKTRHTVTVNVGGNEHPVAAGAIELAGRRALRTRRRARTLARRIDESTGESAILSEGTRRFR